MSGTESPYHPRRPEMWLLMLSAIALDPLPGEGAAPLKGDPSLVELLRDAQVSNQAPFRAGSLSAHVELLLNRCETKVVMDETIWWDRDGDNVLFKFRASDPTGSITETNFRDIEWSQRPWVYRMRIGDRWYAYNPDEKVVHIRQNETGKLQPFLELMPAQWFRCCPPNSIDGRPWAEMIGPHPAIPAARGYSFEINREGADKIRQIRRDQSGGVTEIVFSFEACGNVVEIDHTKPGASAQRGSYRWRKTPEGICVLSSCEFVKSVPGRPEVVDSLYRLIIHSIDISNSIDRSIFTPASFLSRLPPDVKTIDHIKRKTYQSKSRQGQVIPAGRLDELADQVKSRGFLKPR